MLKKIKKDKKGILISAVVKLVLAVIGIIFLIGLGYMLVDSVSSDSEYKKAEAQFKIIKEKVNILEEQGSGSFEYLLLNPEGWALVAFPTFNQIEYNSLGNQIQDFSFEQKCQKCLDNGWENCICFCPDETVIDSSPQMFNEQFKSKVDQLADICSNKGFCFEIKEEDVLMFRNSKDWETVFITDDFLRNGEVLFVNLESNILEVTVN